MSKDMFIIKEDDPSHYVSNWKKLGQLIELLASRISKKTLVVYPPFCVSSDFIAVPQEPSCISPCKGTLKKIVIRVISDGKPPTVVAYSIQGSVMSSEVMVDMTSGINTATIELPITEGAIIKVIPKTPNITHCGFAALIEPERAMSKEFYIELPEESGI